MDADARHKLTLWCDAVGPPVVTSAGRARSAADAHDGLTIVSWNVHAGRGDVARLVASLAPADVVLLMQEATAATIARTATALGMSLVYVPSMRNGTSGDDRGNAILSTLPMSDPAAIELPWVRQRRVAVVATVHTRAHGEMPIDLRVASVHLDNRPGRKEQSAALAAWLRPIAAADTPLVLGGDLNTWFGAGEDTVSQIDAVAPRVDLCGERPTFRFRRQLDHLFTTLPRSAMRACEIARETFNSDHHPLILRLL